MAFFAKISKKSKKINFLKKMLDKLSVLCYYSSCRSRKGLAKNGKLV